ncbi:uracil phosphoribosyltransferase [Simkania negevensis]|uniref:Uracil phosphoribosyltransferase n=1 Tax=Simkania negevensis (strain ATCC VR-1471 / DSM 27360 / Z) TaxID=331113 RepID=F8L8L5_SIMNZ|nr:uracil phosphoribosyltransferase [Simkania negevensis]MCB1068407.1 uracil phosphoribosyltransferase [Simkania sp.]MCP5490382.1 uracil phosphoribosyltransferase [Chlamydiales bacterium]CCB89152.1 uracil phosphoribosyltransferase [Simkania negevensis Z]
MKKTLLSILRDRSTSTVNFRKASDKLAELIATDIKTHSDEVVLIPILRAGIALLYSFLQCFQSARVGFIGVQRDRKAQPVLYYENLPAVCKTDSIIILDPIIATGGSTLITLEKLTKSGSSPENITLVGMIAAPEGLEAIKQAFPAIEVKVSAIDKGLDDRKYIVPGLGDFGDRYFGC